MTSDLKRPWFPRWRAAMGAAIWLATWAASNVTPFDTDWVRLLIAFAALVVVPLGLDVVRRRPLDQSPAQTFDGAFASMIDFGWRVADVLQPLAAGLLTWSLMRPQGTAATLAALPWLALTVLLAGLAAATLWNRRAWRLPELGRQAACLMIPVGAAWTVADRMGYRPLGFDPVIVLLTGAHFHYAGFVLPILAGCAAAARPGRLANLAVSLVLGAVPLVAVGITLTQLGLGYACEIGAALVLATGGMLVAGLHVSLARGAVTQPVPRILWGCAAAALGFGMSLAALYGSRFVLPVAWLTIPWMRVLHGTTLVFGFALPGLAGWSLVARAASAVVTDQAEGDVGGVRSARNKSRISLSNS